MEFSQKPYFPQVASQIPVTEKPVSQDLALKIQTTTRTGVGLRLKVMGHVAFLCGTLPLVRWEVQMWTAPNWIVVAGVAIIIGLPTA